MKNNDNKLNNIQLLILRKIESFDKISLFFHESPDFDTLGSCFGVKEFIKDNFPDKTVKIIGLDTLPEEYLSTIFINNHEAVSDDYIKESLGIISDTANSNRVYTKKYTLCNETIRVDHHIEVENFCDTEWVDPIYPAACLMWADLFINSGMRLSPNTAKYLYAGILTDTGRFLHHNTTPDTYLITHALVMTGFNREEVHSAVYSKSKKQILFSSDIQKRIKIKNGIAWAILPKNIFRKYQIQIQHSMVHLLSNIKGVDIWSTLYYDSNLKCWKGSLRSVNIPINHIAQKFGGGGHKFAAGFKLDNKKQYKEVIDELQEYLKEIKK